MSNDKMLASPRQRQEFAKLLRTIRDIARPPVFFARESNEEMEKKQREYKRRQKDVLTRYSPLVDGLKKMTEKYPELRDDFKRELKDIGL